MKNEVQFLEILDELSLKNIHISGFEPEQIFYQIEPQINEKFENLENEINIKHKKFLQNKQKLDEMNDDSHISSEEDQIETEEYSDEDQSDISIPIQNESEESNENSYSESFNESNSENSLCDSDEKTISFESEIWMESHSSDAELLNRPACEVRNLLWGNKKRR